MPDTPEEKIVAAIMPGAQNTAPEFLDAVKDVIPEILQSEKELGNAAVRGEVRLEGNDFNILEKWKRSPKVSLPTRKERGDDDFISVFDKQMIFAKLADAARDAYGRLTRQYENAGYALAIWDLEPVDAAKRIERAANYGVAKHWSKKLSGTEKSVVEEFVASIISPSKGPLTYHGLDGLPGELYFQLYAHYRHYSLAEAGSPPPDLVLKSPSYLFYHYEFNRDLAVWSDTVIAAKRAVLLVILSIIKGGGLPTELLEKQAILNIVAVAAEEAGKAYIIARMGYGYIIAMLMSGLLWKLKTPFLLDEGMRLARRAQERSHSPGLGAGKMKSIFYFLGSLFFLILIFQKACGFVGGILGV